MSIQHKITISIYVRF